jgi:hypothetical protein
MFVTGARDVPVEHTRKLVRSRLLTAEAVSLDGLASFVGQDHESVARVVDALVADGEVEILRPVGNGISDSGGFPDEVFYRRIRATDPDFTWEKELIAKPARDERQEIKKAWLKMIGSEDEPDLSVLRLIHTMNML